MRNNIQGNQRERRCRRYSYLIGLLAVLTMLSADVGGSRIQRHRYAFTVHRGNGIHWWSGRQWTCIRGNAQLRKKQRKDRDRYNTHPD